MIQNLKTNKKLWSLTAALAMFVAIFGLAKPSIYDGIFEKRFIAAQFPQDILTILVALFLFYLIVKTKEQDIKKAIIITGINGALCYLYAIFSIERAYNELYLFYLAIFSLSFFSIIYTCISVNWDSIKKVELSRSAKYISIIFSMIIGVLFTLLWVSALIPLMKTGDRINFLYSIYLLDLCFVMPAFIITAIMILRNKPFGYLMTPAVYILGIFVILPLGLGEIAKPYYDLQTDTGSMLMSFILSGSFIFLSIIDIYKMKLSLKKETN
jgi:hypothetical protein